jgi:hypothetical protein
MEDIDVPLTIFINGADNFMEVSILLLMLLGYKLGYIVQVVTPLLLTVRVESLPISITYSV